MKLLINTLVTYRSPNNQRVLNYHESSINQNNQVSYIIENDDYAGHREKVLNVIEPKQAHTSWYCDAITNKNTPNQIIDFDYEKFGGFNYFQEFEQPLLEAQYNTKLLGSNIAADYTVFKDIFLTRVTSKVETSPFEILELDYELIEDALIPQPLLNPRDAGVEKLDSLYSFTTVYSQGINNDFEDWRRYYHGKSDSAAILTSIAQPVISNLNPYLTSNNGTANDGYVRKDVPDQNQLKFAHGFLESPRILTDNTTLISGDIYEIRTQIADSNGSSNRMGNGTVDINIATGDMNLSFPGIKCADYNSQSQTCNQFQYFSFSYDQYPLLDAQIQNEPYVFPIASYNATRGGSVFTTFNQAIKWNMASNDNNIRTSNFFVMPNVPSYNDGMNIQIGPGNSDIDYSKPTNNIDGVQNGAGIPSAYKAYSHMPTATLALIQSYQTIPHSFGIGLPWSMVEPLYEPLMGGGNLVYAKDEQAFRFWWSDLSVVPTPVWDNEPTKFNENVLLQEVELIRYSKSPYMLKSAKVYRVNGEMSILDDTSALILVSNQEMKYGVEGDRIIENLNYRVGKTDTLIPKTSSFQYVYTLNEIKNIPVAGWENDPTVSDNFVETEILQTEFEYDWYGMNVLTDNINYDLYANPGRRGRIMTKFLDQLGGETLIEYYPYQSASTLKESKYTPITKRTPNNAAAPIVIPPSSSKDVHPAVHFISRLDENNNLTNTTAPNPLKRWEYVYDTTQIIFQTNDFILPANFRDGYTRSYSKGFANTTKFEPQLISGEKPYTFYEHHGNIYQPIFDTLNNTITPDPPTIEEYLFFGKPKTISLYNSIGILEEETSYEYGYTQAHLNGYERNNFERDNLLGPLDYSSFENWVQAREYEYADYYNNEQPSYTGQQIIGYNVIYLDDDFGSSSPITLTTGTIVQEGTIVAYINSTGGIEVIIPNYEEIPLVFLHEVTVTGNVFGEAAKPIIIEGSYLGSNFGGPTEKPRFLETFFYNDLKQITSNLDFYFHSYFCKTVAQSNKVYDNSCSKNATQIIEGIPSTPGVISAPFGGPFVNIVSYDQDQQDIAVIIGNEPGNGIGIVQDLKDASPLSEINLLAVIQKTGQFKSSVIRDVLIEQPALSDALLSNVFANSFRLKKEHVFSIIDDQPYLSDPFLQSITSSRRKASEDILQRAYAHNDYLSNSVMITMIQDSEFSQDLLKTILVQQPQLSEDILLEIINESNRVSRFVVSAVLLNQPVLTDSIFNKILDNIDFPSNDIVKIFINGANYPQDETLSKMMDDDRFSDAQLFQVIIASTRVLGSDLMTKIQVELSADKLEEIFIVQTNANPYGHYCNNITLENRLFIETITEYEYYEAGFDGSTLAEGYLKLMGLEDVQGKIVIHPNLNDGEPVTLNKIILKHEPSWQLFKSKTYSPNYPDAYSEDEYYYYYDLLN